jgi:hypothetical protein
MFLEVFLDQQPGAVQTPNKRKTARILTGTPFLVNTTKLPVTSPASMIYQACS